MTVNRVGVSVLTGGSGPLCIGILSADAAALKSFA